MGKGRDSRLIKLRDEALWKRYYYWTEVQRLRFDDCVRILSREEFFVSEETVIKIIRKAPTYQECKDVNMKKIKSPHLTKQQLSLLLGE